MKTLFRSILVVLLLASVASAANKKISDLDAMSAVIPGTDLLVIHDASAGEARKAAVDSAPFPAVHNIKNYGAVGNGTTDDTAAIQAAYDACNAAGGGTVWIPGTSASYYVTDSLTVYPYTSTQGDGNLSQIKFKPASAKALFVLGGDFYGAATINVGAPGGEFPIFQNFFINLYSGPAPTNSMAFDLSDFSFNGCLFENVRIQGIWSAAHIAIYSSATNVLNRHNNVFRGMTFQDCRHADGAFQIHGNYGNSKQFNNNHITKCKFGGNKIHLNICGNTNLIEGNNFGTNLPATPGPVLTANTGGTYFRAKFTEGYNNTWGINYFETGTANVLFYLETIAYNTTTPIVRFLGYSTGLETGPAQVAHVSKDRTYAATYVDTSNFTIASDVSTYFTVGRKVWCYNGDTDGWMYGIVDSSAFGAGVTTVTLLAAGKVTANLSLVGLEPNLGSQPEYYVKAPYNTLILTKRTAVPEYPREGLICLADRTTWDPCSKGAGGAYFCWYDGAAWKMLNEQAGEAAKSYLKIE